MPTFRCPLACATFGLPAFLPAAKLLAWLGRVGSRAWFGCCGFARGGVPPGFRAWCWGSPAPSVLPRCAVSRFVLFPGEQTGHGSWAGGAPFCACFSALGLVLCACAFGFCLLPFTFGLCLLCPVSPRLALCFVRLHLAFAICFTFGPLPFVPFFAFGRSFRSPWWTALAWWAVHIWLERLLFLRGCLAWHLSLRVHARHLAVIRLVLLPTSFSAEPDWA